MTASNEPSRSRLPGWLIVAGAVAFLAAVLWWVLQGMPDWVG